MSEVMQEFICLPVDMQKDILKEQGIVSTLTHSPKQVAKHFIKWRANKHLFDKGDVAPVKVIKSAPVKAVKSKPVQKDNLRAKVFAELDNGVQLKQICSMFDITYANAHYYKRQWKKG